MNSETKNRLEKMLYRAMANNIHAAQHLKNKIIYLELKNTTKLRASKLNLMRAKYERLSKRYTEMQSDREELLTSEIKRQEIPDTKYKGWTNYATWRINLEIFDGYDPEGTAVEADALQELAEKLILIDEHRIGGSQGLFLSDVNWHEIANGINEAYELAENKGIRI